MKKADKEFLKEMEYQRTRSEKLKRSGKYQNASIVEVLLDLVTENDPEHILETLVGVMRNVKTEKRLLREKELETIRERSLKAANAIAESGEQIDPVALLKHQIDSLLEQMVVDTDSSVDYSGLLRNRIEYLEKYLVAKVALDTKMQPIEAEPGKIGTLTVEPPSKNRYVNERTVNHVVEALTGHKLSERKTTEESSGEKFLELFWENERQKMLKEVEERLLKRNTQKL